MDVQRQVEGRHRDTPPQTEIDTPVVAAHHPPQIHAQPLAGRAALDGRNMLLAARSVLPGEKLAPEVGQHGGHALRGLIARLEEIPDAAVTLLHTPQGQHEIAQVPAVERAVDVGRKQRQFALRGVAHEIRRSVVHEVHHAVATADNGLTVAPGDGRGEKSRDLAVGAVRIAVRYRNRIVGDEVGAVVFVVERVEQLLQIGVRHGVRSIRSKTSVCGMP